MNPKVSIIIPTYNQAKYLGECIKSAVSQNYENKEIIISDDFSTDDTEEIVRLFQQKSTCIRYFKNSENKGRVANYKISLDERALGDLVLMLDGDDYLIDTDYISEAVRIFEKNPEVVMVFADIETYFETDGSFVRDKINTAIPEIFDGNQFFINFYKGFAIPHLTCLYNKKEAQRLDFYRENILSSDWESILRLILNKKVGFIGKHVGVWRKHPKNASRSNGKEEIISNLKYIENAFLYAEDLKIFSTKKLNKSRRKLLKRYFFRILVQTVFFEPENLEKTKRIIQNYSPEIYRSVNFDFKYIVFKLIRHSKHILFFVTKYIQKQESMLKDLQLHT